jgi:uncharacterized repeat protein (TIGR01451 family)
MSEQKSRGRAPTLVGALQRPVYAAGSYLAAHDLLTEQRYRLQRLRRHNRYLHGWGVICGLLVVPATGPRRPWAVHVCPGYALSPYADEIEVQTAAAVDVRDYLWRRPHDASGNPVRVAYVGIRYVERQARPVPSQPPACRCEETIYEPSRIEDAFQVDVLWQLPKPDDAEGFDMCAPGLAPCPECPESPYVVLARVNLPASEGDPITRDRIDNFVRRQLFSTTRLQGQLIACCCQNELPPMQTADLHITNVLVDTITGNGVLRAYTITVTNHGPSVARNVVVEDNFSSLPDGVEATNFQTTHGEWTQTWPNRPFLANLGQLEPSQMATLRFNLFFPSGVTSETDNMATVQSDIPDPDPSNNRVII